MGRAARNGLRRHGRALRSAVPRGRGKDRKRGHGVGVNKRKLLERVRNNPRDVRFSDLLVLVEAFGYA